MSSLTAANAQKAPRRLGEKPIDAPAPSRVVRDGEATGEAKSGASGQGNGIHQRGQTGKYGKLGVRKDILDLRKENPVTRLNSTSSLYVDHTLSVPDNKVVIRNVAESIQGKVQPSSAERGASAQLPPRQEGFGSRVAFDAFDEPVTRHGPPTKPPSCGEVEYVIRHVFKTGQLSVDCNIVALVYVNRLLDSGMVMTEKNWRPILTVSLMLASKVWDDLSMINEDFSTFLPFSLEMLNVSALAFQFSICNFRFSSLMPLPRPLTNAPTSCAISAHTRLSFPTPRSDGKYAI